MPFIPESSQWTPDVYELETTDPALAGPAVIVAGEPTSGHLNAQAKQLADRTLFLKDLVGDVSAAGRDLINDASVSAQRTTLGLGTAALGTVTTTTVDSTVGRVLRVGDGGWLSNAITVGEATLNDFVRPTGVYYVAVANLGFAPINQNGYLWNISNPAAGYLAQEYILTLGGVLSKYFRRAVNSVWSSWEEVTKLSELTNTATVGKGAAWIGRGEQIVNTIVELKALLKTTPSRQAFVNGYYVAGDGGGGEYRLDIADTTTADNGGTVIVATDGGRWKLVFMHSTSIKQWGAKGDGVTEDTTFFQAALNSNVPLTLPAGTYICKDISVTSKSVDMKGAGRSLVTIKQPSLGAGFWFHFTTCNNLNIQEITFDGNNLVRTNVGPGSIRFTSCNNSSIHHSKFINHNYIIIQNITCDKFTCDSNEFTSNGNNRSGLPANPNTFPMVWVGDASTVLNTNYVLSNNNFYTNLASPTTFYPNGGLIKGNVCKNNSETAFYCPQMGRSITVVDNHVDGQVTIDGAGEGIELYAPRSIVSDNRFINLDGSGITLFDVTSVTVKNNIIGNCNKGSLAAGGKAQITLWSIGQFGAPGSIIIEGNIGYDDQATATTFYGLNVGDASNAANPAITNTLIRNNNLGSRLAAGGSVYRLARANLIGTGFVMEGNLGMTSIGPVSGTFTKGTTGSGSVTGIGFRPRYLEFYCTDANGAVARTSKGTATIGPTGTITSQYDSTYTTTSASFGESAANRIVHLSNTTFGTEIYGITLTSVDGDGFTYNVVAASITPNVHWIAHP